MTSLIEIDARSRVTLPGKAGRRYLVTEDDDGTLTLTPAVVMSELEAKVLASQVMLARFEQSHAQPDRRRPRPARRAG